jgi:hypothetical protein
MGLDYHGLSFLRYVNRIAGGFGNTITLGRQEVHVRERIMKGLLGVDNVDFDGIYCEDLLRKYFGASKVESIDYSPYEHATYVHDMGVPLPESLKGQCDTVIDGGTLEHVFNIVQGFSNTSDLVRVGGQIIHILPANNHLGHGFWQMSPELFFSLYSEANGYAQTEVYLANFMNNRRWFKVKPPSDGQRVNAMSFSEMYVLVRTVKIAERAVAPDVQQSDYSHEWESSEVTEHVPAMVAKSGLKQKLMNLPFVSDHILLPIYYRLLRLSPSKHATGRNPGLDAVSINALVHEARAR